MKKIFANGIIKENAVLVLLIGICPALAVTTSLSGAIGMGAATAFVLVCSNILISLLRKVIPKQVRIPCYIVIISGFVVIVKLLIERYLPALGESMGIYLGLIVANCIVLMRAEVFAEKNGVLRSAADGLATGIGFTLALALIAAVREVLGAGTFFGKDIPLMTEPMAIFVLPAGAFFALAFIAAGVKKISGGEK
jgi:Predicted NADH:ubiquinone oxidoreductase, subunit RnfE